MKGGIIALPIIILLLGAMSGCIDSGDDGNDNGNGNEPDNNGNIPEEKDLILMDYTIITGYKHMWYGWKKLADGMSPESFDTLKDVTGPVSNHGYLIEGGVKNNVGRNLYDEVIIIRARCYDEYGTLLFTHGTTIQGTIPNNAIKNFSIYFFSGMWADHPWDYFHPYSNLNLDIFDYISRIEIEDPFFRDW